MKKNSLFKYILQSLPSLVYYIAGLWWGCIVGLTVMNITLTLFVLRLNWREEADKVGQFSPRSLLKITLQGCVVLDCDSA